MGCECPINRVAHCVIMHRALDMVLFRYYFVMVMGLFLYMPSSISGEPYSNFGLVISAPIYFLFVCSITGNHSDLQR